ncbi:hypothetical protein Tco_0584319, partial [Tanacetum coccineum]
METQKPLLKDVDGEDVDEHLYRSMIESLMYLTSSRPDIMFTVCACARFQVNPKRSHLHAVKRIFRYLKCKPKLGLWYPKDFLFDLVAYTDSDYARASLDRKSTIGGCQFLGCRLILWQCKKQTVVANSTIEAEYIAASTYCGQRKESRRKQRKDTEDPQLSGLTEPITADTKNVASVPTHSNDPLLSGEDRLKLTELMELLKKLEKKKGSRTQRLRILYKVGRSTRVVSSEDECLGAQEDASKQGRKIDEINQDAEVTLVDETQGSTVEVTIDSATTTTTQGSKVVVREPSEFTTTTSPSQSSQLPEAKNKGKAKMIEPEEPLKKKDQIMYDQEDNVQAMIDADYELAARLQTQEREELTIEE